MDSVEPQLPTPDKPSSKKKALLGCVGVFVVILAAVGIFYGPALRDFIKAGFFEKAPEKQAWHPDTEANLKALYTALKLQHDSDGQFPKSSQWMEKILARVKTETLKKGDEAKKFVDPAAGGAPGVYGFAMNDAASEKYIDDLPDKKAPLIFQSTETAWNAHGDPAKIGRQGGIGLAADGSIVKL